MEKNILAPAATNIWVLAASFFGEKVSEMWLDLVAIYPPLYTIFFAESPANARKLRDYGLAKLTSIVRKIVGKTNFQ